MQWAPTFLTFVYGLFVGVFCCIIYVAFYNENRLYIRPGSASPSPSGHEGLVTITDARNWPNGYGIKFNQAINVTLSGETTVGSGTRNMRITNSGTTGIGKWYRFNSQKDTNNQILYLEIDNSQGVSQRYANGNGVELLDYGMKWEVAYNYIHHNHGWGIIHGTIGEKISGYGLTGSIHDNVFELNWNDTLALEAGGWDIYGNVFWGDPARGLHADAIQSLWMYVRIYNNIFHDHTQEIFFESSLAHIRIYNNIFYDSDRTGAGGGTEPGIIEANRGNTMDDVIIVNNTFHNLMIGILFQQPSMTITNSMIANNIFYNNRWDNGNPSSIEITTGTYGAADLKIYANLFTTDSAVWQGVGKSTNQLNAVFSGLGDYVANRNGSPLFVNVSIYDGPNHDYHLQSGDTNAKGKGKNLASLTNMGSWWPKDKDGVARPEVSAWDIGAYEHVSGSGGRPNSLEK